MMRGLKIQSRTVGKTEKRSKPVSPVSKPTVKAEKTMGDTPYSIYCPKPESFYMTYYTGLACNKSDLIAVKILEERYDSDNVCTEKEVIYRCRVCGGFYKHEYSATYYEDGWMGDDHGWMIDDHYYKIEEPYRGSIGALHEKPPLPLDVARAYGYTGEDYTWKNNR